MVDVAYLDLDKDPALFEGDASEEYQYEIYRYMRGAALFNNPLESPLPPSLDPEPEEDEEEDNIPVTPRRSPRKNTHIRFDSDTSPDKEVVQPRSAKPSTRSQEPENVWRQFHPKTNLVWLHFVLHKLLNHLSNSNLTPDKLSSHQICQALHPGGDEDTAKVKKKAMKLWKVLQSVSDLLCPVALGRQEGLGSVKELVVLALEERWLGVRDVAR